MREGRFREEVLVRDSNSLPVYPGPASAACGSDEIHQLRASIATDLKFRAEHYRRLADMLFDEQLVSIVRDCACELEREARSIEYAVRDSSGRKSRSGERPSPGPPTILE